MPRAGACVGARLKINALYDPGDLRVDNGGDGESESSEESDDAADDYGEPHFQQRAKLRTDG
jgi:hypothetical protein